MNETNESRVCTDCALLAPAVATDFTLVSARHGWRLMRSVDPGGLTFVDRGSGTFRLASATATIGGQTFDASELQFADFGVSNDLTLTVCPHGC